MTTSDPFHNNLRLSELEYKLGRIHLQSRPRCLGLVLGNGCNLDCPHCYQSKNGDNLLKPPEISRELRREFIGLYPYLSTLRLQGGEAFAYAGFRELLDDVASAVRRPILSISTNGTLINDDWAERIVRAPFLNVTISIDGATPATFARLRKGGELHQVLAAAKRIRAWKDKLGSPVPHLDSFFVIMRSNFREIPRYLELMREHGFEEVAMQTMQANPENTGRIPTLVEDESLESETEIRELHRILADTIPRERRLFRCIRVSGLTSLFDRYGLDQSFLSEESQGLYPDNEGLNDEPSDEGADQCPNPWTTLFITENGDASLCFLSEPVGNIYEEPVAAIWNNPKALAKRSRMLAGRYVQSGCSEQWCGWRDGARAREANPEAARGMLVQIRELTAQSLAQAVPLAPLTDLPTPLGAVRRQLQARGARVSELEALFAELCEQNAQMHDDGQKYIDSLESQLAASEAHARAMELKSEKAVRDFEDLRNRGPLWKRAARRVGVRLA